MAEELLSGKPNLSEQTFPEAELFNPHDLVVVTNCYYPDYRKLNSLSREKEDISGIRGDLAIQLITETLDLGAHMVVSVSQCSDDFMAILNTLRENGLIIVNSDSPDRAPQRRIAFHAAGLKYPQAKLILYTQAEKTGLIKDIQAFCEPILNDKADVIVLSRDTGIFENSYPKYLWESETRVNKVYNWVLRKKSFMDANPKVQPDFDWFFGPFLFKRELLPLFLEQYELFDSIPFALENATGITHSRLI